MATTTTSKTKETTREATGLMSELSDQAFKNWEQALRSGIRMQEQAGQWWNESLNAASVMRDWQQRVMEFQSAATRMVPESQRQVEQIIEMAGKNTRAASELYNKAMDAAHTPYSSNGNAKWLDLWTSSLEVMRGNAQTLMNMNNQALATWSQFIRKSENMAQNATAK